MQTIYITEGPYQFRKYRVTFDEEQLIALKKEILRRCCPLIHRTLESTVRPPETDYLINLRKGRKVGVIGSQDGPDYAVFEYQFDEYLPSPLVLEIDKLLNGERFSLETAIASSNGRSPLENLQYRANKLSEEFNQLSFAQATEKIQKLAELQKVLEVLQANGHLVSDREYYDEVQNVVKIELIEILEKKVLEGVYSFFGTPTVDRLAEELQRIQGRQITKNQRG